MSDHAIRVDGLSKQYRIGGKQQGYKTLRDTLAATLVSPFRRARKLLRGQAYGAAELGETIWALKDVSCEIERGEVVGIIGPNGAGKTTLLKILSRITEPTEGQAEIHGRVGSLLEVGTGFHPELTGRENIYLNGAILGMKKAEIEQKFDEMVSFAEIDKFIDTPVKHYSSGMYVRLAFAVAAHLEPEILLVDEVLAVGDAAFQRKCLGKMENVAKEGRTVLFVSHNMPAVQQLCSKALLLEEGNVTYNGEVGKCIDLYLEKGSERSGSILSHLVSNDSAITINRATVNGSKDDVLDLAPSCRHLDVTISGWIDRPMRLIVEARIYDLREQCLAFYTPRQIKEDFKLLPAGTFRLRELIGLPPINQGEYFLSLYIAELIQQPVYPVHIHKAVRIRAEGTPTVTGWVYKYARGNGWMLLSSMKASDMGEGAP
jgi:lipopolysaccharide transport system ATP-binding protein